MSTLLVGCYSVPVPHCPAAAGKGVSVFTVKEDGEAGLSLEAVGTVPAGTNPSFVAAGAKGLVLVAQEDGAAQGALALMRLQGTSLTKIGQAPSGGQDPCYISINESLGLALVANYSSGTVGLLKLSGEGEAELVSTAQLEGHSGVVPSRQEAPHAHSAVPAPDWASVYVADLGNDAVYRFTIQGNQLKMAGAPTKMPPGTGPRHIVLHQSGKVAFVSGELTSTVEVLGLGADGSVTHLRSYSTLPPGGSSVDSTVAELALSPDHRFLYVSNRGHDSIAVFRVEGDGSELVFLGCTGSGGKTPRHFVLTPSGRFLLAANQDSDSLVLFRRDGETGLLSALPNSIHTPAPVCLTLH